jgi:hypothetical protein
MGKRHRRFCCGSLCGSLDLFLLKVSILDEKEDQSKPLNNTHQDFCSLHTCTGCSSISWSREWRSLPDSECIDALVPLISLSLPPRGRTFLSVVSTIGIVPDEFMLVLKLVAFHFVVLSSCSFTPAVLLQRSVIVLGLKKF